MIFSFQTLKKALVTAPILAYPQFASKHAFILDTDWGMENGAVGACLSQKQEGKERVIAYAAKRLSKSQLNYAPTKGELYAVIYRVRRSSCDSLKIECTYAKLGYVTIIFLFKGWLYIITICKSKKKQYI